MSYRVDIPTLSANEVYTLTFEYEGTETIQLVVGDLTLETTDRRVVFTTTSPVHYIESNMNLTNLNMYEGYYESDDFGGEYTQESYIEGMSLVNLIQSQKHLDFQNNSCGVETFEDNMIKLTITDVSSLTSTWQNGWIKTSANLKVGATYTCVIHVVENSISTEGMRVGANYGTLVHGSDSNSLASGETGTIVFTYTTGTVTLKDYNGYYDSFCRVNSVGDWQNGSLKYGIMIFEGDYYDYFINNNIPYFEGIGCVKSPTIKSLSPENLYVSPLKYREPLRGYEYYHNDGTVEIYPNGGGVYSTIDLYTGEDVGYSYSGNQRTWYVNNGIKLGLGAGTYYFCCEIELVANKQITDFTGRPQVDVVYDNAQYFSVSGDFTETYDGGKYYYKGRFGAANRTVTDDIRGVYVGIWSYGISGVEKYIIRNITLTKEASLKDICAISKSSIITTPDDLELYCNYHYDRNTKISNPCYQDTLDLTTGTITRKNIKVRLNDCIAKSDRLGGALVTVNGGDMVRVRYDHTNSSTGIFPVQIDGEVIGTSATGIVFSASQGGYDGAWYPTSDIEHAYTNTNTMSMYFNPSRFDGIDYTNSTTIKNWLIEQDFTLIIKIQNASVYTEQLPTSLNALKSYRNGSIQTSSQQLTPTLKTTLPISNKFTTTNLTSGSTYNVYFDGTATKLDAGGTIITNPVSPCEVECGGTTLTIEGTDIQNVRVIETTNKNEVGSVCGTTDVELSRIKTKCRIHNIFDDYFQGSHNTNWAKDYYCTSTRDDTTVKIVGKSSLNYAGYSLVESLPFGTYKLHYKVKVSTIGDKYKVALSSNPNGTPQDAYVPVTDVTSTALVEEQTFVFYKKHITNMLFYTYRNGQEIEYYDISLIKLSDEDITGTDTSNINYSQVISDLEQPIKLRSLGTTHDSYNPVTGELTKRIDVSETDGSYSVLSSPIINRVRAGNTDLINISASKSADFTVAAPIGDINDLQPSTTYTLIYDVVSNDGNTTIMTDIFQTGMAMSGGGYIPSSVGHHELTVTTPDTISGNFNYWTQPQNKQVVMDNIMLIQGSYANENLEYFEDSQRVHALPQLYTNGQVKVYSDSDVYPTTILNGQSTNNYEINELNTSNNYTIRYDGTCESINLAKKSNTQGTNRIVKAGATSGNLTFVNGVDIDNVLLVQNDVREQEINHFNGLETVEVSQLLVSSKQNLFEAYMKNDFDYEYVTPWNTSYSSLHRGVFNCGVSVAGNNSQLTFDLIHPKIGGGISEETPIMKAGQIYNISCDITVNDDTSKRKYEITFYAKSGSQIYAQKVDNILPVLSLNTTADNTNTTAKINANTFFNEDVYGVRLHAIYGGQWAFDCTITDFTICEPEYAKPDVPLVYEYIDLPQPVQLNSLLDGTHDTYNPITGEYIQNVGYLKASDATIEYRSNTTTHIFTIRNDTITNPPILTSGWATYLESSVLPRVYNETVFGITQSNLYWYIGMNIPKTMYPIKEDALQWVLDNVIILYKAKEPIITQLTPITIPTFEGGILQLITTDGKVFPMVEYSMPTNNRYDTSSWEAGAVYTQRNMTEVYFNDSTTPMIPTETMTLTTDHISSGSIILNDNGNGLIVLKGNYTGRDIPYFTGMRSVEAIEVETSGNSDQPLFGKGGRR